MYVILFGAPGVGKGTQAELVVTKNNIAHLSTGEEFRRNIKEQTELGKQVQSIVDAGKLVTDDLVTAIVRDALANNRYSPGCLFDGYPRTLRQAQDLDNILCEKQSGVSIVINIVVPENDIIERLLKRGRADDTVEVIRHRLQVYNEQTAPLLHYYQDRQKLVSIDGSADVETVNSRIQSHLQIN